MSVLTLQIFKEDTINVSTELLKSPFQYIAKRITSHDSNIWWFHKRLSVLTVKEDTINVKTELLELQFQCIAKKVLVITPILLVPARNVSTGYTLFYRTPLGC